MVYEIIPIELGRISSPQKTLNNQGFFLCSLVVKQIQDQLFGKQHQELREEICFTAVALQNQGTSEGEVW